MTGELLDSRAWDPLPRFNQFEPTRDPTGGAWITAIEHHEADDLADQSRSYGLASSCSRQPLIMAVSAEGEAEWAHRVETCGVASQVAFREDATFEVFGLTGEFGSGSWDGAWLRTFELH